MTKRKKERDLGDQKHASVVQANYLIENRPKLTLDETRLLLTIISTINKEDDILKPVKIPVSQFANLWGIKLDSCYDQIKEAMKGLVEKSFTIEDQNDRGQVGFTTAVYFVEATYYKGDGEAVIKISNKFAPYLLQLKEQFTYYDLEHILNLSSVNAIRMYELLKQYETIGHREFELDAYKKTMGLEGKYPINGDLKRRVLDPSTREVNEKSDLKIDYQMTGRGKNAKIEFQIKKKEDPNTIEIPKEPVQVQELFPLEGSVEPTDPELMDDETYALYLEAVAPFKQYWPKLRWTKNQMQEIESIAVNAIPRECYNSMQTKRLRVRDYILWQVLYINTMHEKALEEQAKAGMEAKSKPIVKPKAYLKKALQENHSGRSFKSWMINGIEQRDLSFLEK